MDGNGIMRRSKGDEMRRAAILRAAARAAARAGMVRLNAHRILERSGDAPPPDAPPLVPLRLNAARIIAEAASRS